MFFLEHPSEATAHLREATSGEVEVLKLFNGLMGRWHFRVSEHQKKCFKKTGLGWTHLITYTYMSMVFWNSKTWFWAYFWIYIYIYMVENTWMIWQCFGSCSFHHQRWGPGNVVGSQTWTMKGCSGLVLTNGCQKWSFRAFSLAKLPSRIDATCRTDWPRKVRIWLLGEVDIKMGTSKIIQKNHLNTFWCVFLSQVLIEGHHPKYNWGFIL